MGCYQSTYNSSAKEEKEIVAFLSLRTHEPEAKAVSYPLWEIEVAARKCEALFAEHWPLTHRAFVENGRVAP